MDRQDDRKDGGRMRYHTIDCCLDCTNRHEACHDHCDKYLEARAKYKERREKEKHWKYDEYYLCKADAARRKKAQS